MTLRPSSDGPRAPGHAASQDGLRSPLERETVRKARGRQKCRGMFTGALTWWFLGQIQPIGARHGFRPWQVGGVPEAEGEAKVPEATLWHGG